MVRPATGAIRGTNWTADAPVPITPTRRPLRSTSWRQRAEWKVGPAKRSSPGSSGTAGRLSPPVALITAAADTTEPSASLTDHRSTAASHRTSTTSAPVRTWPRTPRASVVRSR